MKKLLFGTMLLALVIVVPIPTMAGVNISINFPLPPPIVFAAPPELIVIPETYVYVAPDIDVDFFFWNGWWWRPWEGRWYRSYYYDRGWAYYDNVPSFYFDVDFGWRGYYREHNWYGHPWNYERIHYSQLHQNWRTWNNTRHWERHGTWGVQGYQPRPQQQRQELRNQRQQQYQQRPEVQQHQQQRQQQPKQQHQVQQPKQQHQVQQPKQQHQVQQPKQQPQVQQPKQQPQVQQPQHSQPQGKPGKEEAEHKE